MQRDQINFTVSDQIYNNPTQKVATTLNNPASNIQPQSVNILTGTKGSRVQGIQTYGQTTQQIYSQGQTVTNVQPAYVGTSDNYGYGFSQQKQVITKKVYETTASIPRIQTVGYPGQYQTTSVSNQNVGGSKVGGTSFVINPSTVTSARPVTTIQTGSSAKNITFVQPTTTATFVQPTTTTTTFVQPITTSYVQPATATATMTVQPTSTYVQQDKVALSQQKTVYQTLQKTSSRVGGTEWVQEEFARPKYPKLYNNSAQYYRNLAPQDDPTVKKTVCSPICWFIIGLIGLLALAFGVLCGLGIFCGDSFNLTSPFKPATNETTIKPSPTGPQHPVTPVEPQQPVNLTGTKPVTPVGPQQPTNLTGIQQPVTTAEQQGEIPAEQIAQATAEQQAAGQEQMQFLPVPVSPIAIKTVTPTTGTTTVTPVTGIDSVIPVVPVTPVEPVFLINEKAPVGPTDSGEPTVNFIDPSVVNTVPVTSYLNTFINQATTSPQSSTTYGYDLGYQPVAVQADSTSVPLLSTNQDYYPTYVEPVTTSIQ